MFLPHAHVHPRRPNRNLHRVLGVPGYRYLDTGEEIPDVPRDCIRVLTLTPGMKVEARYGGGLDFYPGTIDGINSRCVSLGDSLIILRVGTP